MVASIGMGTFPPAVVARMEMFARLVLPSLVGGGGIDNVHVFAVVTSVRSTASNSAVFVTA